MLEWQAGEMCTLFGHQAGRGGRAGRAAAGGQRSTRLAPPCRRHAVQGAQRGRRWLLGAQLGPSAIPQPLRTPPARRRPPACAPSPEEPTAWRPRSDSLGERLHALSRCQRAHGSQMLLPCVRQAARRPGEALARWPRPAVCSRRPQRRSARALGPASPMQPGGGCSGGPSHCRRRRSRLPPCTSLRRALRSRCCSPEPPSAPIVPAPSHLQLQTPC